MLPYDNFRHRISYTDMQPDWTLPRLLAYRGQKLAA